jgi:hypothetical protein
MDTIPIDSAIKYFFPHDPQNPNDVRWNTYCNTVSFKEKLPDTIDKSVSPYMWLLMHAEGYNNNNTPGNTIHPEFSSFINDVAIYHRKLFSEPFKYLQLQPSLIIPFEKKANQLRKNADDARIVEERNKKIAEINTAATPSIVAQDNFRSVENVLKAITAEFGNNDLDKWLIEFKKIHPTDTRPDDEIYDAFWFELFENTNLPFISAHNRADLYGKVKTFEKFYREFKRISLAVKDLTDPKYKYNYIMVQEFITHPQTLKFADLSDEFDNYAKVCAKKSIAKTIMEVFDDFLDKLKNDTCSGIMPQKTYAIADDKEVEKLEKKQKNIIGTTVKQQKLRIRWDEWVKNYKMKFKYPTETNAIVYVLDAANLDPVTFNLVNVPTILNVITQNFATSLHTTFDPQNKQIIDTSLLAYTRKIKTEQNREIDMLDLYELVMLVLEPRINGAKGIFDNLISTDIVIKKIIAAVEKSSSSKFNKKISDVYHSGNDITHSTLIAFNSSVNDELLLAIWNWVMMQTKIYANDPVPDFKWDWIESVTQYKVTYDPILEKYEKSTPIANTIDSFITLFTEPYVYVGEIFKYVAQMPIGMFGKNIIIKLNEWLNNVIKNPFGFKRAIKHDDVFNAIWNEIRTRVNATIDPQDQQIIGIYDTFITTQAPGTVITIGNFTISPLFTIQPIPQYLQGIFVPPALQSVHTRFETFLLKKVLNNAALTVELEKIYSDPMITGALDANGIALGITNLWAPQQIKNNPVKKMLVYFVTQLNAVGGYLAQFNALPVVPPIALPIPSPPLSKNAYGVLGKQYISTVTNKKAVLGQNVLNKMYEFEINDLELKRINVRVINDPIILYEFFIYLTTLNIYETDKDILYKSLIEVLPRNIVTDDVWSVMKLIIQNPFDTIELYSAIIAYNDYLIGPPPYNGSQNKQHTHLFKEHLLKKLGKNMTDKIYNVIYPLSSTILYNDFLNELNGIGNSQIAFRYRNKQFPVNTYLDIYDFVMEYSQTNGPNTKNSIDVISKWKQYYNTDKLKQRKIMEDYMIHLYESIEAKKYVKRLRDKYNVTHPIGSDVQALDAFTRSVWIPPTNFISDFLANENAKNIMVGGGHINSTIDPLIVTFRREIIDNFNNLKQNEKDFYEKFVEIITVSGTTIKLGTHFDDWKNCYVVLRKTDTDVPIPIFSEYVPNDDSIRANAYLGVYSTGQLPLPPQYVVNTKFDLNFNKLVLPIITPKNTKLIKKAGRTVRVDAQNNVVQFNETCHGTLFHGQELECEQFYKICITTPDLDKCTDMLQDSYFENVKNPDFVNEMNPKTALAIVKALGFNIIIIYDIFTKCMRKKIESVSVWKTRNFDVLKNKKNTTMFYKYLESIVNYINEYSFILNTEPCHQESTMFSPYSPMSGGGSPAKQLVLYIKFNRRNRKEQIKSQQPFRVNSDELIQTMTNLLTNFFDDLVKQNIKFSYTDIEKINKYLHRIADCTENLAKVSDKLNKLKQLHHIVQTTPSVTKSEHVISEVGGRCKYCSDKISSAEKKLLLVISKLIG